MKLQRDFFSFSSTCFFIFSYSFLVSLLPVLLLVDIISFSSTSFHLLLIHSFPLILLLGLHYLSLSSPSPQLSIRSAARGRNGDYICRRTRRLGALRSCSTHKRRPCVAACRIQGQERVQSSVHRKELGLWVAITQ